MFSSRLATRAYKIKEPLYVLVRLTDFSLSYPQPSS